MCVCVFVCVCVMSVDGEDVHVVSISPADAQENFVVSQGRTLWRQDPQRRQVC